MRIGLASVVVLAVALTGCGTKSVLDTGSLTTASPTGGVSAGRIDYDAGLFSMPASADDLPGISLAEVQDYVSQSRWVDGAGTPGKPEIELRQVTQNGRTSLQWVVVWHHSPLSSRGPAGPYPDDSLANCDMILMLDAATGGFTLQVQLCAPPPAGQALIDAGKMAPPPYNVQP